jgi:hypothetical protein
VIGLPGHPRRVGTGADFSSLRGDPGFAIHHPPCGPDRGAGDAGAIGGLLFGRLIDKGRARPAVWLNAAVLAVGLVLRSVTFGHVVAVVTVAVGTTMLSGLYLSSWMTPVYNEAKISPCVLRFQFAAEGGWDVGGALAGGVAAAIGFLPRSCRRCQWYWCRRCCSTAPTRRNTARRWRRSSAAISALARGFATHSLQTDPPHPASARCSSAATARRRSGATYGRCRPCRLRPGRHRAG